LFSDTAHTKVVGFVKVRNSVVVIISFLVLFLSSGLFMIPTTAAATVDCNGAYVDKIIYNVITQDDQQVLALQNNEIDLIGDMVDPTFLQTLTEAEDIDVANVLRNGYGYVTINTAKNPFNYTAFRRALAFALDKEAISDDVWDGLSQPQDSVVPVVNPYTIEGQLPYTYYEANVALGNDILDAAGFDFNIVTGFRDTPNGDAFDVLIEVAQSSNIAIEIGQKVAEALTALDIEATSVPTDFYEYLNRLYFHGDYDIVFIGSSFNNFDVDWLAYEYWSDYADEPYFNFPNFANASYDSWRDQLLHATEYTEVYEAAIEMQKIWVYQSPMIICYENILLSAYRTDRFEGHVNDVSDGVPGWWTNYKVHLKDAEGGPLGGTFRWSNSLDVDSFNFMVSSSDFASNVNQMMWDSLIRVGPDGNDVNWLAEDYFAETHDDNPSVPAGYTQFIFDMIQNATWTDGAPLTADDVAFTLNYYRDAPGNPYGVDLVDMVAAYAPTTYRLIVQFNSESFWHLHSCGYKNILPKHVFTDIGVDSWNLWNPDPPTTPMVTSGPYNVSDYVAGEFIELTYNPNYFYGRNFVPANSYPDIDSPSDMTYLVGTTGHSILWDVSDDNPVSYEVKLDGVLFESGSWDGSDIGIDIDGLSLGTYDFTLTVEDSDSNSVSDSVIVNVVELSEGKIVFDYSHGQLNSYLLETEDAWLAGNLTEMGYEVVWAMGGINSSILADAQGLVAGSIYENLGYSAQEIADIADWFNSGNKFMWIGYDDDYPGKYINDNMTAILSAVGSHVYGEPTAIHDSEENCGASYRAVANTTSSDPFVSEIVEGVSHVLMHGATCLFGSTIAEPNSGIVSLEDTTISEVYPLLYYSAAATIYDYDLIPPLAHTIGQTGLFTATTLELSAGVDSSGIIIVSGASPYGDYRPMYTEYYRDVTLTGNLLVLQAIRFGMISTQESDIQEPTVDHPPDISLEEGLTGYAITWNPSDENPANYTILIDDEEYRSGPWNASSDAITIILDELLMGEYNFTIILTDTYGNIAKDTVIVTIVDNTAPSINHPDDIQYFESEIANSITWEPEDLHPWSYQIFINGSLTTTGNWNSSLDSIEINVDGLAVGVYNYTIVVSDTSGNRNSDSVIVVVLPAATDPTEPESPFDIIDILSFTITIGSLVVIVVIVTVACRARRVGQWESQFG